jgi:4-hydroxy-tetrahydrodipicolinate synthase
MGDNDLYSGMFPALLIPMNPDYSVDIEALVDHINDMFNNGCKGAVIFGTTGEAASFPLEAKKNVLKALIDNGIPSKRLMVGVGHSSIEDTVDMIDTALKYNVLAVLWHPPFYYKNLSDDGVVAFYKESIERVNNKTLKVVLYNFPMLTGVPITHNIIEKLYNLFPQNIIGVKDSCFDYDKTFDLIKKFPHLKIYVGKDTDTSELVRNGAVGAIVALSNIVPNLMSSLYEYGKDNTKPNRNDEINKLWNLISQHYLICSVKAIMASKKGPKWNVARPPLFVITQIEAEELVRGVKEANINS